MQCFQLHLLNRIKNVKIKILAVEIDPYRLIDFLSVIWLSQGQL